MFNPHIEKTVKNVRRAKVLFSRIHHNIATEYAIVSRQAENILDENDAFEFSERCRQTALYYYNMVERLDDYITRQINRLDREVNLDYYLWSAMRLAQSDGRTALDSIYRTIDAIVTIGRIAEEF